MPGPLEREVHALRTAWHAAREEFFPEASLDRALSLAEKAHAARDGRAYAFACLVRSGLFAYLFAPNNGLLCAALREGLVHKGQLRLPEDALVFPSRNLDTFPSPELALELATLARSPPEDLEAALASRGHSAATLEVLLWGALLHEDPLQARCLDAFLDATRGPQRHMLAEEALRALPLSAAQGLYLKLRGRGMSHTIFFLAYREGLLPRQQVRPRIVKGLSLREGSPPTAALLRWLESPSPEGVPVWPERGLWLAHTLAEEHRSTLAPSLAAHLLAARGQGLSALWWVRQLPSPLREQAYAHLVERAGGVENAIRHCPSCAQDLLATLPSAERARMIPRLLARGRPLLHLGDLRELRGAMRARRVPARVVRRFAREAQDGSPWRPLTFTAGQLLRELPELDAHALLEQLALWGDEQWLRELPALAPYLPRAELATARLLAQRLAHPHERAWALLCLAQREGPLSEQQREELLALSRETCAASRVSQRLAERLEGPPTSARASTSRPPQPRHDEEPLPDLEPLLRALEVEPIGTGSYGEAATRLGFHLLAGATLFYDEELERLRILAERDKASWFDLLLPMCSQGSLEWLRPRAAMLAGRAQEHGRREALEILLVRCPEACVPVPWSLERWAAAPALELGELKKALRESDTIPQGVDFDRLLRTRSTEERWLVGEVLLEHASRAFPPAALKSLLAGGVSALLGLDRDALAGLLDDFLPPSA